MLLESFSDIVTKRINADADVTTVVHNHLNGWETQKIINQKVKAMTDKALEAFTVSVSVSEANK